ncbi:MAG TPA: YdjY domain-containing protein, partial [Kiritimatiellia bacterium]
MALIVLSLAGCASAPPPPWEPEAAKLIRVGTVQVDEVQRMVIASGYVNQVDGAIELFACGKRGKTHESVLVLSAYPVDLHAALLLLGAKCGAPASGLGVGPPRGDDLAIWVEWVDEGTRRVVRAEELAAFRRNGRKLSRTDWVFTGSTFEDGKYKALVEESLVATYWDPWAVINIR